MVIIIIISVF